MLNLLSYGSKAQPSRAHWTYERQKCSTANVPSKSPTLPFHFNSNLSLLVKSLFFWRRSRTTLNQCNTEVLSQRCQNLGRQWRDLPSEYFTKISRGDRSLFIYCVPEILPHLSAFTSSKREPPSLQETPVSPVPSLHLYTGKAGAPIEVPMAESLVLGFLLIKSNTTRQQWFDKQWWEWERTALGAPGKAQDGLSWHTLPCSTRTPWQMAPGTETEDKLKEVPTKGLWLRQNFHFSAQLHLSLLSWKHSLPSDEMRPWRLHHSLSHFSLSGLQTTTFPKGLKYYSIYFLIVAG